MAREKESSETTSAPPIEIGNSIYQIPEDAKQYIQTSVGSTYEKARSVLIINEPHYNVEAQFNLYKFLEAFFGQHPDLVPKTAFLAEGLSAHQPLSIQPLIELEPNPSEETIWQVLNSFLITGYMAYEWKHQQGIPIIGTENPVLYRLSHRLWPLSDTKQEAEKAIPPLWDLSVTARNQSITRTLLENATRYENPILFVGSKHVIEPLSEETLQHLKSISPENFLSPEEINHLGTGFRNWSIHEYLRKTKLGYTFIHMGGEPLDDPEKDTDTYKMLFLAQQSGDYDQYFQWLLAKMGCQVTSTPDPIVAAKFLQQIKQRCKEHSGNPNAKSANQTGFDLARKREFIKAAENYAEAAAAEPGHPGYLYKLQLSLIKGMKAKILGVEKTTGKKFTGLSPEAKSSLPVYGPYIKKDHHEMVTRFHQRFGHIPGEQEVRDNAMSATWKIRYGGILQIETADSMEPRKIRAFEERHKLSPHHVYRVDISTKNNVAVECKNFTFPTIDSNMARGWIDQAIQRLLPDVEGHRYKSVVIVIPNGKNVQDVKSTINQALQIQALEFSGKIRACQVSDVRTVLAKRW